MFSEELDEKAAEDMEDVEEDLHAADISCLRNGNIA